MTRSSNFFSLAGLFRDSRFLASAGVSLLGVIAAIALTVAFEWNAKIAVSPLVTVSLLQAEDFSRSEFELQPLANLTIQTSSKKTIWSAFASSIAELCDTPNQALLSKLFEQEKAKLLIADTNMTYTVADPTWQTETCQRIRNRSYAYEGIYGLLARDDMQALRNKAKPVYLISEKYWTGPSLDIRKIEVTDVRPKVQDDSATFSPVSAPSADQSDIMASWSSGWRTSAAVSVQELAARRKIEARAEWLRRQHAQRLVTLSATPVLASDHKLVAAYIHGIDTGRMILREILHAERDVPRAGEINFQISIGATVPESIKMASIPQTIGEVFPAWWGLMYFVAREQLVIVDPKSRRIVALAAS